MVNYLFDFSTGFLRCFRDAIRVPIIKENYHRVPTGPYRVPNIFLKKMFWYNGEIWLQMQCTQYKQRDLGNISAKVRPTCSAVILSQLTFTWPSSVMSLFQDMTFYQTNKIFVIVLFIHYL